MRHVEEDSPSKQRTSLREVDAALVCSSSMGSHVSDGEFGKNVRSDSLDILVIRGSSALMVGPDEVDATF